MAKQAVFVVVPLLLVALCLPAGAIAPSYTITSLGALPNGLESVATDVNDSGQVVGYSRTGPIGQYNSQNEHAYIWQDGVMTDLGVPVGDNSQAFGINNQGQVVGLSFDRSTWGPPHAFLWDNGVMSTIDDTTMITSQANEINDQGQVVGYGMDQNNQGQNFVWQNGVWTFLPGPAEMRQSVYARTINNLGQAAGQGFLDQFSTRVLSWDGDTVTDVGDAGSGWIYDMDMNDLGDIVYTKLADPLVTHAYWLRDGQEICLGTMPNSNTRAMGINNSGQIVGSIDVLDDDHYTYACLWEDGKLIDLRSLLPADSGWGWLGEARAISDTGYIVGYGGTEGGIRAFLMSPVPEPSSMFVMVCGLCSVAGALMRRKNS